MDKYYDECPGCLLSPVDYVGATVPTRSDKNYIFFTGLCSTITLILTLRNFVIDFAVVTDYRIPGKTLLRHCETSVTIYDYPRNPSPTHPRRLPDETDEFIRTSNRLPDPRESPRSFFFGFIRPYSVRVFSLFLDKKKKKKRYHVVLSDIFFHAKCKYRFLF